MKSLSVCFLCLVAFLPDNVFSAPSSGALKGVKCYVCQRSAKSGYTSPYQQSCTFDEIKDDHKKYVQTCKDGFACKLTEIREYSSVSSSSVIAEYRECAASNSGTKILGNTVVVSRYCRGHDCTAKSTGLGTAPGANEKLKCRLVSATKNVTLIDENPDGSARTTTNCSADTSSSNYYCSRKVTTSDAVVYTTGNLSPYYELGCVPLNKKAWTANQYQVTEKYCVNDFCNVQLATSGTVLKASVVTILGLLTVAILFV